MEKCCQVPGLLRRQFSTGTEGHIGLKESRQLLHLIHSSKGIKRILSPQGRPEVRIVFITSGTLLAMADGALLEEYLLPLH